MRDHAAGRGTDEEGRREHATDPPQPCPAARLAAAGLTPVQLGFGGTLDLLTRPRLGRALREFGPAVAVAWMNRAAAATPVGPWVLAGRLGGYYDLRYYRRCDHLVGNTQGIAAYIRGQGWPAERVHYLPNFAPDLLGATPVARPPGPMVLALGRLHRNKAFDVLVRALPHLPGVHAVIAGDGPERRPLEELARRERVADRLHMPGWQQDRPGGWPPATCWCARAGTSRWATW